MRATICLSKIRTLKALHAPLAQCYNDGTICDPIRLLLSQYKKLEEGGNSITKKEQNSVQVFKLFLSKIIFLSFIIFRLFVQDWLTCA